MSNTIVLASQGLFQKSFELLTAFIEQCPEELWQAKKGGWPLWQQVAHSMSALCFFVDGPEDAPITSPCPPEELRLTKVGTTPVPKAAVLEYARLCKARADAYIAGLTDAQLTEINRPLSARLSVDTTHAGTLCSLGAHTFYHLGGCDAILRESGHPGIF